MLGSEKCDRAIYTEDSTEREDCYNSQQVHRAGTGRIRERQCIASIFVVLES